MTAAFGDPQVQIVELFSAWPTAKGRIVRVLS